MPRIARVVVPNIPHHVTQRSNRKQTVYFKDRDYEEYLILLRKFSVKFDVSIWAYCLMPNHVHLIAAPHDPDGLTRAISEVHRRYSQMINRRFDWKGHLWQTRYASCPMDQTHLLAAARYIERNPVRAGLVKKSEDWSWSSARHHLGIQNDHLISSDDLLPGLVNDWSVFISSDIDNEKRSRLQMHQNTGRPLGDHAFVELCENLLERKLKPAKPGPRGPWKHKRKA